MANIWEAPQDIGQMVRKLQAELHTEVAASSIWVLCSDAPAIRDNRVVATQTARCTKTEKLSTGHDFKITIMTHAWANLTDAQRKVALDEALCRCGVKHVPAMVEINGKKEAVKDELGRVIYTDEIALDSEGAPRWKINKPDAGLFFGLLARHGQYGEEAENVMRCLEGRPVRKPMIAERADAVDAALEAVG